jgi:uncharacterized protein (TIGR03067 family)
MKARLLLGCLALLGVTAFAPAPFPRPGRVGKNHPLSLGQVQGTWTILKLEITEANGGMRDQGNYLAEVRIDKDRWSFFYRDPNSQPVVYLLSIDPGKNPALLDLTTPGQAKPYGTGIVSRQGNVMRVLYSFGKDRPASFERRPPGYWHLTLQFNR